MLTLIVGVENQQGPEMQALPSKRLVHLPSSYTKPCQVVMDLIPDRMQVEEAKSRVVDGGDKSESGYPRFGLASPKSFPLCDRLYNILETFNLKYCF